MMLWPRGQYKVHQMSDGRLALTIPSGLHNGLLASARLQGVCFMLNGHGLRTQQQHPHPQAGAFSGLYVASVKVGCSGGRASLELWNLRRKCQCLRFSSGYDSQDQVMKLPDFEMEKVSETEYSRSSRW